MNDEHRTDPEVSHVVHLLSLTRDLLERRGWNPESPCSLWMAVVVAELEEWPEETAQPSEWAIRLQTAALAALTSTLNLAHEDDLIGWEREPERRFADVVAALESAVIAAPRLDLRSTWAIDPSSMAGRDEWIERVVAGHRRWREAVEGIRSRSGVVYERYKTISDAYRAAGRPRRVYRAIDGRTGADVYTFRTRRRYVPATEADWNVWEAWMAERERLRQSLANP